MYFSNVVGKDGIGRFTRKNNQRAKAANVFENTFEDVVEGGVILDEDGVIRVVEGNSEKVKEQFGKVWKTAEEKDAAKAVDLADTLENPLIWCLTDEITLLENTRTYFKFIPINNDLFLFCLVEGVCKIGSDKIPLIRNISPVEERERSYTYRCVDLCNLTSAYDKETGFNMIMSIVCAMVITHRDTNRKISTIRDCQYVLTEESLNAFKKRQEEIRLEKERKRAEQLEARKEAERKAKLAEIERERKEDIADKPIGLGKNEGKSKELNQGAAAFLQMFSK